MTRNKTRLCLWLVFSVLLLPSGARAATGARMLPPPAAAGGREALYPYQGGTDAGEELPSANSGASISGQSFDTTLYTDIYNANHPYSVHVQNLDAVGNPELVIAGVLTDYSWVATPNPRCGWCNEWRLNAYSWDGTGLTSVLTGTLDSGYDTLVRSTIGTLGGATKVVGVGNLYPCGSGEPHAGMAVFDAMLQPEHYDWGNRRSDPCHHDMSHAFCVDIADVDGDGTQEIVAGGSGDSSGGTGTYREWLLAIRTSDGSAFDEELYTHFDHGAGNEALTDLVVADVDGDGTQEIVATGYSQSTGVNRTVLHIWTWDGTTLKTEQDGQRLDLADADYLHRVAVGDVTGDPKPEIVLAGQLKWSTSPYVWFVEVLRWDGASLTEVANGSLEFDRDAIVQAIAIADVDRDGQNEIVLAGNVNQEAVPGSAAGYGPVHYYADWYLRGYSLSGATWTLKTAGQWESSRDYDTNDNGQPDAGDQGTLGRLYDLDVGDLDADGHDEVALVGEWVWVGWHVKILNLDPDVLDSDGDGLLDEWERDGMDVDDDGTVDLDLPALGADPMHKDIFVEVDYMEHHKPNARAIQDVVNAFANAPVSNPEGGDGIDLHVIVDEEIAHQDSITAWPDFDTLKQAHFGTSAERNSPNRAHILDARRKVFRYCLFVHKYNNSTSSGLAERPGNDFIVALGAWTEVGGHNVGSQDEQAGTFMHELGHTLGLRHGGGDGINCKPNYLSVMSYSRQMTDIVRDRRLDYSRSELPTIKEDDLDESLGIQGPANWSTAYGPCRDIDGDGDLDYPTAAADGAIDWDGDGTLESSVQRNLNNLGFTDCDKADDTETLTGYDDWANLMYDFRGTANYADGVHAEVADPEMTWETVQEIREIAERAFDVYLPLVLRSH
jgi:hypothetical protein